MAVETVEEQKVKKGRKGKGAEVGSDGEQLYMLDVKHPAASKIKRIARAYKKVVRERVEMTGQEVELKRKLLEAVRETDIKPNADGVIEFKCDGVKVTVTPRDELVRVKDEEANGDEG